MIVCKRLFKVQNYCIFKLPSENVYISSSDSTLKLGTLDPLFFDDESNHKTLDGKSKLKRRGIQGTKSRPIKSRLWIPIEQAPSMVGVDASVSQLSVSGTACACSQCAASRRRSRSQPSSSLVDRDFSVFFVALFSVHSFERWMIFLFSFNFSVVYARR